MYGTTELDYVIIKMLIFHCSEFR